jgi:hypothetical protein
LKLTLISSLAVAERGQVECCIGGMHLNEMGAKRGGAGANVQALQTMGLTSEVMNECFVVERPAEMCAPIDE